MNTASCYSSYRQWKKVCKQPLATNTSLDIQVENDILQSNVNKFIGWLLFHLSNIGSNGRQQMFYVTFIAQYYGLSRNGVNHLAKYGYGVTNDMADVCKQDMVVKSSETTRYLNMYMHSKQP